MDYNPLPLLAPIVHLPTGLVDAAVALPSRLGEAAVLGGPVLLDPSYQTITTEVEEIKQISCVQLLSLGPPWYTASTALGTWSSIVS